jgi:hypothetical protein
MPLLRTAILTLLCVGSSASFSRASDEPPARPAPIHKHGRAGVPYPARSASAQEDRRRLAEEALAEGLRSAALPELLADHVQGGADDERPERVG